MTLRARRIHAPPRHHVELLVPPGLPDPPHVHEGWLEHQWSKMKAAHEMYKDQVNPYTPIATEATIVVFLVIAWLIYKNRRCWRTNKRFWYELYCLILGGCIFLSLYLSCSLEHNCMRGGVSVSRLTNRGLIGRLWAFMMLQAACHFVIVQTWLLSYVYKRSVWAHALFVIFPVTFVISTVLTPAHMGLISDELHSLSTILMGISGFSSWLWTAYKARSIPEIRRYGLFRVLVILAMATLFSLCAIDNVFSDVITKMWASSFLAFEILTIFGICVIHMSIFYGEMRFVKLNLPSAQHDPLARSHNLPC